MELHRVAPEPRPPDEMVGPARCDDAPEARTMAEDSEMGELVDDDRLEGLGRGEDEPPAEHEPALARRAPPAAVRVPQGDCSRIHGQRCGVTGDLGIHGDAGPLSEPRLENAVDPLVIALDEDDVELVAGLPADPGH